ncbi:hypothetical protein [Paenibacillus sp. NPDC058071]|uniref:hypothetical protein n=1 Tax=Paenibacillus sp. NPDC058071 TaxID=3346326 RepID=UPI0036DEEDF4
MKDRNYDSEEPLSLWKVTLWIVLYAAVCGVLLAAFTLIESVLKFVLSLVALYFMIRFFKKYERWSIRISFIICTLLAYFSTVIMMAFWLYMTNEMAGTAG